MRWIGLAVCGIALVAWPALGRLQDTAPEEDRSPPHPVPANKEVLVLFSGEEEQLKASWTAAKPDRPAAWPLKDGALLSRGGDIVSRERFTDFQLHVEFKVPYMPNARGQGRGNSGVFLQGRYEIQVLDSFGKEEPGRGDCGAVYNKAAPLLNACKRPLQWQTYDITFRAPRFDPEGKKTENARVSVFQNGVCIQNNQEIDGPTWGNTFGDLKDPGPIVLQDHGNAVQYRNIWVVKLPPQGAARY
jgi:hypothetical protein